MASIADSGYVTQSCSSSRGQSLSEQGNIAPMKETSLLEGLELNRVRAFKSWDEVRKIVSAERDQLKKETSKNHKVIIFGLTGQDRFKELQDGHESISFGRYAYDKEKLRLIITVFAKQYHEVVVMNLGVKMQRQLYGMGIDEDHFLGIGCADFEGSNGIKQPDASYKPKTRSGSASPPSIVFEAGYSESLPQLRRDAEWWLSNASGRVNIVLLVAVYPDTKKILLEKWTLTARPKDGNPGTRSRPAPLFKLPTRTAEIKLVPETKGSTTFIEHGAPLVLEFEELLDRVPVPPEMDVIVTGAQLTTMAKNIWEAM